jgi:hypothetical protein
MVLFTIIIIIRNKAGFFIFTGSEPVPGTSQWTPDDDEILREFLIPDSEDIVQHGGGHQELGEPSRKRARLDDPAHRQQDRPLPLPIEEYYDLEGPVTKRVVLYRINGQAYTIKFKNYEKMVDLERILIGIFAQVRNMNYRLSTFYYKFFKIKLCVSLLLQIYKKMYVLGDG